MDFLSSLLAILPSTWYGYLAALVAAATMLSGSLSYLNAGFKQLLWLAFGAPTHDDTGWKARLYTLATWLDWLAINSQKVVDSKEFAVAKSTIAAHEQKLFQLDDRVVDLTAQVIDHQDTIAKQAGTILRQKSTLAQTFGLTAQHPDNDNGGTTYVDGSVK